MKPARTVVNRSPHRSVGLAVGIREHGHVLTPGRYVGTEDVEDDDKSFEERMTLLTTVLGEQLAESASLQLTMREQLRLIGFPLMETDQ